MFCSAPDELKYIRMYACIYMAAESVFLLLQNSSSHQQRPCLEDYIPISVMLHYSRELYILSVQGCIQDFCRGGGELGVCQKEGGKALRSCRAAAGGWMQEVDVPPPAQH